VRRLPHADPTGESGRNFKLTSYEACASCHGTASNAQGFADLLNSIITSMSDDVKEGLDQWSTAKSPVAISPYGALALEYENAGEPSSPGGTGHGPTRDS
jgi:hypothetical protein